MKCFKIVGNYVVLYNEWYLVVSIETYYDKVCLFAVDEEEYFWFDSSTVLKDGEFYDAEVVGKEIRK